MQFNALCKRRSGARPILTKTWRIMRLTAIFLLLALMQVSAKSWSQKLTLNVKDAPLEKVFKDIRKQTGYDFLYNDDWLQDAKRVTIDVTGADLKDVLNL